MIIVIEENVYIFINKLEVVVCATQRVEEKSNKMEKWKGRVAMVTGASSGIGAAICEDLVKHGMKVVGAARRIEKMQELAKKLKNEKGTFLPVQCDVTKDEDIYNLFDKIKKTFGGVDVCINNAGMVGCGLDLLNGTPEEWRQITNVKCDRPLSLLKTDGEFSKGKSIAAHQVLPLGSSHFYTGTKFAVRALSEGLRQELQAANFGIKLSVVSPGLVKTEFRNPEFAKQVFELNTNGTPEEWRQITNVNVIALCLCSKLTVNSLKERGLDDGHIINIISACHKIFPASASHFYQSTKWSVRALFEGLRQELQAANSGIKLSVC
ncbi:Dehydrogenase/reductase SDR family member 11 [Armadillidium nasatum]|uniref:Dehydrogenase/reductase SDR family member 11 n=1 Tax=Armadillidium nasatum TaxID=96803 RepID=A0A5N5SXF0_9CRUS|nr:Dehydrogenase/reductase SDR family member 11 [Armadillidium nasatum]